MEDLKNKLFDYLTSFKILSEEEIRIFLSRVEYKKLKKNEYFVKQDMICNQVAFVGSGLIRSFYFSSKSEELTYCFIFPNRLLTAYSSFLRSTPSRENMQAIVDSELLIISKFNLEQISIGSNNWMNFLKLMAEEQYLELEYRVFQLQKLEAKSKYLELLNSFPEIVKEIPLQYIASYLGITQRHLSRIRKELVKN